MTFQASLGCYRFMRALLGLAFCASLLGGMVVWAQQAVPALTAHVMDTSGTLAPAQLQQLDAKLAAFEAKHGAQVVVLLVRTTQPEDIASYANRVANAWKIGRRDLGDGLFLLVATQDRRVRIEVAKSLEGAIPDLAAKRIIESAITPLFRQSDYAGGIEAGLDQIMALIAGEKLPAPGSQPPANESDANHWAFFLFFVLPLIGALARRLLGGLRGAFATGSVAALLAYLVTSSLLIALGTAFVALIVTLLWGSGAMMHGRGSGRSGPGGWAGGARPDGGFGGGGFRSGGGGDFGGGGASGDW